MFGTFTCSISFHDLIYFLDKLLLVTTCEEILSIGIIFSIFGYEMKDSAGKSRTFPRAKVHNDGGGKHRSRDKISRAMKRFGKKF